MCDPVTITTIGNATGSAFLTSNAATIALTSQIALTAGTAAMGVMAARNQEKIARAKYNAEQRQLQAEQEQLNIEQLQVENNRREEYISMVSANNAMIGAQGVTAAGSYKAVLGKLSGDFKQDLSNTRLQYGIANTEIDNRKLDSAFEFEAAKTSAKTKMISSVIGGIQGISEGVSKFNTPSTSTAVSSGDIMGGTQGKYLPLGSGKANTSRYGYNPYKIKR